MKKFFTFLAAALMSASMFATTVTWNSSTLSSITMEEGRSFTKDGVTLTTLDAWIEGSYGDWMGSSNDASFKFSTSLGNFTKIEITATVNTLSGSGWTQTSPGAVWTGEANETTFGKDFSDVTQIVFTIGEGESTGVENVQASKAQVAKTKKIFRNGQMFILKDGEIFNLTGSKVK